MLHVLPHTFKLACVAGIQKGRERVFWAPEFHTPPIWNACLTGQFEPVLQQIRLQGVFFVDGKTRFIPIQLILQKIHNRSCTFFVACFTIPLSRERTILSELASYIGPIIIVRRIHYYPPDQFFSKIVRMTVMAFGKNFKRRLTFQTIFFSSPK